MGKVNRKTSFRSSGNLTWPSCESTANENDQIVRKDTLAKCARALTHSSKKDRLAVTLLGLKKESRTWMQQTVSLLTTAHEWSSTLDVPTSFFQDFLGSSDIKIVVKFECMGFKAWRSNRLLSHSL